jgi:o-succinylbenzoate synthase
VSRGLTIDRARLWEIALPLTTPFVISGGTMRVRRSLIVELTTRAGATGFGESAPFELPFYSSETIDSARALLTSLLLPRLVGRTLDHAAEADALLRHGVRGNPFARAGAETAVWDAFAHEHGVPLLSLLVDALARAGVAAGDVTPREQIACGIALGIPEDATLDSLRAWTREALGHGYQRVKIKIRPGWDVAAIRAVRDEMERAGAALPLWADANASYDLLRDRQALEAIDEEGLLFIEQPLAHDDVLDHASLATWLRTPLCLDESLRDARWARQALETGASRIWNIKVQRIGGLTEAIRLYALAAKHGVSLWGGTMPESGIGARAILALSTLPRFIYPSDVEPSARWYGPGVDLLELTMSPEGTMPAPSERGLASLGVGDRLAERGRPVWTSSP